MRSLKLIGRAVLDIVEAETVPRLVQFQTALQDLANCAQTLKLPQHTHLGPHFQPINANLRRPEGVSAQLDS